MAKKRSLVTFMALCSWMCVQSQCLTQGPNSPSAASNNSTLGIVTWTGGANTFTSNNSRSTATGLSVLDISLYLATSGFNFSIPSSASICGITVEIEKSAVGSSQNVTDESVRLVKDGTVVGSNRAGAGTWPGTDAYFSHGGSSDLWGESWTPSDINSASFGVAIAARLDGTIAPTARIDHVQITVHYDIPLPVDFKEFHGRRIDQNSVALSWTATEINNDYFSIERSADGRQWNVRGKVQGADTNRTAAGYTFEDHNNLNATSYYRIRQTNYDGAHQYSDIIAVPPGTTAENVPVHLYPNPTDGPLHILTANGIARLTIRNNMGDVITDAGFNCDEPLHRIEQLVSGNRKGLYIVDITDCTGRVYYRRVMLK